MSSGRKRGRPRSYDRDEALASARRVFWETGLSASSLDELGEAMSMNRPSLYGAFGDKEALYLETLGRYRDDGVAGLRGALDPSRPLRPGLLEAYGKALDLYFSGGAPARGCFLIATATAEAVQRPAVRQLLADSLAAFDAAVEERLRQAREAGELAPDADPATLARLAGAVMHSLAVRARAGEPRAALEKLARAGVDMVCGADPRAAP